MNEDNDVISNSIDFISDRTNKRLKIIIEEKNIFNNDKNNKEENENKTQFNFNKVPNPLLGIEQSKRANSCEKRKKNKILQKKLQEILDYREKFKSLEEEEKLKEELNEEESGKKKKVETKVNRNLKLLNLIKEKMNQNEIKDENKNDNKNEIDIKNDLNKDIVEEKKENIFDNNNIIENKDKEINEINKDNDINEEKRKKLLKLFGENKKIQKDENNDINDGKKVIKKEEKENINENDNNMNKEKEIDNNKYQKIKIPHPNTGSVSFQTFMKKGTGNFRIQTPKSKQQNKKILSKSGSNEKEQNNNFDVNNNDNNIKENKFSDIPIEQKNKLTINIKQKNILFIPDNSIPNSDTKEKKDLNDNIISLSNKKEENSISNNNSNNNNKKGALKILELLKAKKKEQNENEKKEKNEEEEDTEYIIDSKNINEIGSSLFNQEKKDVKIIMKNERNNEEGLLEANSLPKKKFKEEDEESNFKIKDNYNKTQHLFSKVNKNIIHSDNFNMNNNNSNNNNITNNTRIKTNYFNNINNNINNYFSIGETSNYPKKKTLEYINNANLIRNKINKKLKAFNTTNQYLSQENYEDLDEDIFRIGNNSHINDINQKNSMVDNNNLDTKNLDKSYDILKTRKSPIPKKVIDKNILSDINGPKTIKNSSNNNKYIKYGPYERNTANSFQRNGKIYNKIKYKRNTPAYVKKSPGKINIINSRENNRIQNKIDKDNNKFKPTQNKYNKKYINNLNYKNPNFDNNDGMEISTIHGVNSSLDSSISNRTNNKKTKKNTMLFNLEDLLVLEERLNNITLALEANKSVESQCFNFWNYYFNCSLYKILEKIFQNEEDSNIVRLSINYELMSVMVCYDFSFGNDFDDEDLNLSLIELIYFNHNNLMIICEYILTKISPENTDNIWVLKLQEIVKNSKFSQSKEIKTNNQTAYHIQKILNNTNKIIKKINSLLLNYQTDFSSLLKNYILNLPNKTYSDINNFFRSQILRIENYEGSLVPPSFFKKNRDFTPLPAPYLQYKSTKPYTLILDLDETLVSFQVKSKKEGTLRARPFLFAFLEEMGHYYELIVWTSATEAYANSLIDAIEYDKQYFDFILFREHAIIIGDEFVKDLNRVGRGLDKIIIVDDMPQNFRLQKQNGITIKPFFGDDYKDTALYDLLPILKHIAEEGNDVRIELAKYREEIVKKITSNIS